MPISTNILWIFLMFLTANAVKMDVKRGPFKVVLESINRCQTTTYRLAKDPSIILNIAIVGNDRDHLRANVTVKKDTRHVQAKVKNFAWNGSKWKSTFVVQTASCRGSMLDIFFRITSVPILDKSRCVFLKGTYDLGDIHPNTTQHIFMSTQEYGRVMIMAEINVGKSTYQCWEFFTSVEPI